eukprot:Gb_07826 [translate_table: standard]
MLTPKTQSGKELALLCPKRQGLFNLLYVPFLVFGVYFPFTTIEHTNESSGKGCSNAEALDLATLSVGRPPTRKKKPHEEKQMENSIHAVCVCFEVAIRISSLFGSMVGASHLEKDPGETSLTGDQLQTTLPPPQGWHGRPVGAHRLLHIVMELCESLLDIVCQCLSKEVLLTLVRLWDVIPPFVSVAPCMHPRDCNVMIRTSLQVNKKETNIQIIRVPPTGILDLSQIGEMEEVDRETRELNEEHKVVMRQLQLQHVEVVTGLKDHLPTKWERLSLKPGRMLELNKFWLKFKKITTL